MSNEIDLFLNETYLSHGITKWVSWDMALAPHVIITGQSGSGKTYASKILLAKLSLTTACETYVLDYKSDTDFDFLRGCKNFYRYTDCHNGLHDFYKRFTLRQNGTDKSRYPLILFFDEWSSYCNAGEKKVIEEDKKILGLLISLSRSFSCHVVISQQTFHAVYFNQYRESISCCIMMGNGSEEARKMLFPDYAKDIPSDRSRGRGFIAFNNLEPVPILVPKIRNRMLVQNAIRNSVVPPL